MMQTIINNNNTWIDITNPVKDDLDYLRENFKFHDLDLEDCLSKVQRPKFDDYDGYKFVVLHFPILPNKGYKLQIEEVDIFWGKNFLITLHSNKLYKLSDIFNSLKNNPVSLEKYFSQGCDYLLYKILHELVMQIFPLMTQLSHEIEWIDSTFESMKPSRVIERISALRRNIIFLQTSLKPQRSIFIVFENQLKDQEEKDMDIYWGDIGDYIGKLLDLAEDYQELVEGLYSSIDTLLTFRTNNIMKTLTLFSVIMLPLTLLTGFYGMNVDLPFDDFQHMAAVIAFIMFFLTTGMIVYFKIRRF